MVSVDTVCEQGVFDLFLWPESGRLAPDESHGCCMGLENVLKIQIY